MCPAAMDTQKEKKTKKRKNKPNPQAEEENSKSNPVDDKVEGEEVHGEDAGQRAKSSEEEAKGSVGGEGEGDGGDDEEEKVPIAKKQKRGEKKGSSIMTSEPFSRLPFAFPNFLLIFFPLQVARRGFNMTTTITITSSTTSASTTMPLFIKLIYSRIHFREWCRASRTAS